VRDSIVSRTNTSSETHRISSPIRFVGNIGMANSSSFYLVSHHRHSSSARWRRALVQVAERKKVPILPGIMISPRVRQVWLDFIHSRLIPRYSSSVRWKRAVGLSISLKEAACVIPHCYCGGRHGERKLFLALFLLLPPQNPMCVPFN
jgi:hypothetical protein